jgi:hypothetical protein
VTTTEGIESCACKFSRLIRERDEALARATKAEAERALATSQLLMVASALCGDAKVGHDDTGDPRWTPSLMEAHKLRTERDALRAALASRQELIDSMERHGSALQIERDALRVALAEVLPLVGSAVSDLQREARERHHSWWTKRAQDAAAALDRALRAGKGSTT